jgi:hypothetical protein
LRLSQLQVYKGCDVPCSGGVQLCVIDVKPDALTKRADRAVDFP